MPPFFAKLNLTDDQKAAIQKIFKDTEEERRQKIDAVLTADQKAQLEQMKSEHEAKEGENKTPPPAQ